MLPCNLCLTPTLGFPFDSVAGVLTEESGSLGVLRIGGCGVRHVSSLNRLTTVWHWDARKVLCCLHSEWG